MRDIKFRAWYEKSKKMTIIEDVLDRVFDDSWSRETCAPIWMQYTGLKDKNEKEIYEGDILKPEYNEPFLIEWDNDIDNDCCGCSCTQCGYDIGERYAQKMEIIGNIYENPDLLTTMKNEKT